MQWTAGVMLKKILVIISWLLFLVALIMSYYAAPDKDYGVLRYYDIEIRQFWLTPLTGLPIYFTVAECARQLSCLDGR